MRQVRYRQIADDLRLRINGSEFGAASVLPSESDLCAGYDASRVTIRKALEVLRAEGLVDSRQGFGWFVAAPPLRQGLTTLGTIDDQLATAGRDSERRVIEFGFVPAAGRAAELLDRGADSGAGTEVLRVRRLNLADGSPFALVTVWCPADLAAELSRADIERRSFIGLLPVTLAGAVQTIGAAGAEAADAELLGIPAGAPVLRVERITCDTDGRPVLAAEHLFPGHLTEYMVELPIGGDEVTPDGVRLVDPSPGPN